MKTNFKFMLLALLMMVTSSAFAGALKGTTQYGNDGFKYYIKSIKQTDASKCIVSVSQNVYASQGKEALVIPATVDIYVKGTDENNEAVDKLLTFIVDEIEANGFEDVTKATSIQIGANIKTIGANAFDGCTKVTSITFDANKNNMTIGADAFAGIGITELDLSPITGTLEAVNKWWDSTTFTAGDEKNSTLKKITFPLNVKTIVAEAFAGFTALTDVVFPGLADASQDASRANLTINASAFYETPIVNLDLTNAKIESLEKLFEDDNVTLKTVKMSKWVDTLQVNALANCIQLESVDFSQSTQLKALKAGSLSNTIVKKYDFSNCCIPNTVGGYSSWLDFGKNASTSFGNPFVNTTTMTNKNLETVILPKNGSYCPVKYIFTAFANCEALKEIQNLESSNITVVEDGAFVNDISLTALSFPNTLQTVSDSPFDGCKSLSKLTFDGTALTNLGTTNKNLFGDFKHLTAWTPSYEYFDSPLDSLIITNTTSVVIADSAFYSPNENENALSYVEIAKGKEFKGTINGAAIAMAPSKNAEILFGNINGATFGASGKPSITGPKGIYTSKLTIEAYTSATLNGDTAIVSNTIDSVFVKGAVAGANILTAVGQAKVIDFQGDITAIAAPAKKNEVLTTVNFNEVAIPEAAVAATAFDENNAKLLNTVTWNPATATKAFDIKTFGTAVKGTDAKVTLETTYGVAEKYNFTEAELYNVIFKHSAKPADSTLYVYGTADSDYFYGKFTAPAGENMYIANKTENDNAQVVVYSAFVDGEAQNIYMDALAQSDDKFVVKGGETVIIRVKKPATTTALSEGLSSEVKAYKTDALTTMRYVETTGSEFEILNDLEVAPILFSSDYIGTNYVGKALYFMSNPAKIGKLRWDLVAKTSYLPKGALFVQTAEKAASASELNIIWLDGSEDVTGIIERVSDKVSNNDGAIYNLQGVRVSGAQKGIYIKNGKKFIVK